MRKIHFAPLALATMFALSVAAFVESDIGGASAAMKDAPDSAATAAPATTPVKTLDFATLDTDKNGSISRDEFMKSDADASAFDVIDTDKSGAISPAELKAYNAVGDTGGASTKDDDAGDNKDMNKDMDKDMDDAPVE
ncbi:MAG: hypothetical protein GC185_05580 [Alphaproteobacteria bacterium]|nr:hypothetical protein [Alphaproteobacteria bacterium]